jgi:hypothetical protein
LGCLETWCKRFFKASGDFGRNYKALGGVLRGLAFPGLESGWILLATWNFLEGSLDFLLLSFLLSRLVEQ